MSDNNNFSEKVSGGLTMDKIIEKFIPVIGAILLVTGFLYLLYTNVWVSQPIEVRLGIGFFTSLLIIGGAVSFSERLRYFADVAIGGGILLLYGTLMYGSRATEMASAAIPEVATLITAFIFTLVIAYFASFRKSLVILILSMIGAYLTPFIIGQNDVWAQSISFNAYLTYFASISLVVFLIGRELSIRKIIPLNMVGLFVGTSTLYSLSYTNGISNIVSTNFFTSEIFSAILFLFLSVFSIWSIIISSKEFEEKDDGYIAFGYIAAILWFIFNMGLLEGIGDITNSILFILLGIACFSGWHFLRNTATRFQHTSLYAGGILSFIIGFFHIVPELNIYSSMAIAYSSLIFGLLYILNSEKIERILTYGVLSLVGAILSIVYISDPFGDIDRFQTIYVILALLPAMAGYFITLKSDNHKYIQFAKVYSLAAFVIALLHIVVDFFNYIDVDFFIFYIATFLMLLYVLLGDLRHEVKSILLRASIIWFLFSYLAIFFGLLDSIYPAPTNTSILSFVEFFSDWTLIKGIFGVVIFFLGLTISRELQTKQIEDRPSFILVALGYASLLLVVNYIIFALINDFGIDADHGGIRAICITLWWVFLALFMIITGVKKGKIYRSEKLLGLLLLFLTIIKIAVYDMSTMEMQNKIIVLMMVGGALMMFSYFVHVKGWLKVEEEKEIDLNKLILSTKTTGINKITFEVNGDKNFTAVSKNIIKIVVFVTNKFGKTEFAPGELIEVYKYIVDNYKTELDKRSYNMARNTLRNFVEKGGTIKYS